MSSPTAATRLFALLGDPVAHSLSPVFQNAAIRAAGIDAAYVALRCGPEDLPGLLRGIAHAGGGGNVTVPHKAAAAEAVDVRTALAERTGACNVFWMEGGRVWGDNTDVEGVRRAAERVAARAGVEFRRALVLGAGGAASAALAALAEAGVERAAVVGRNLGRAVRLCDRHRESGMALEAVARADDAAGAPWDLVINATPLGLAGGEEPPVGGVRFRAALDLVYAAGGTPWVRSLRARGIPADDGTEMLLQQGAAAFRRWFSREPDLAVMRAVLGAVTAAETPGGPDR